LLREGRIVTIFPDAYPNIDPNSYAGLIWI